MGIKEVFGSKSFRVTAALIGIFLIALASFAIGMAAGFHKARFSYAWGENYERNFAGPPPRGPLGILPDFRGRDFRNAHGLAGTVILKKENQLIVKDREEKENTVTVGEKTIIKIRRDNATLDDIKENSRVIVIGKPGEDGVIVAELIRVFEGFFEDNRGTK